MTAKLATRAILAPDASSKLLWAASFLDAMLILVTMQILGPLVVALIDLASPRLATATMRLDAELRGAVEAIIGIISFVLLLIVYWLVTEIVLGGRTFGRMCLMMELRQRGGQVPTMGQLTKRGMRKMMTLGFSGMRFGGLDSHDEKNGLAWASPLAAGRLSATRNWKIQVLSGHYAGTSHVVDRLPGYKEKQLITIGRDPVWSNLTLDSEERVSNQHALIRSGARGWEIKDYGGGRGSSNKTYLNGRAIKPGFWQVIGPKDAIAIANVKIQLVPA